MRRRIWRDCKPLEAPYCRFSAAFPVIQTQLCHRRPSFVEDQAVHIVGKVGEGEAAVVEQLRAAFRQPEIMIGAWKKATRSTPALTEALAIQALRDLDPMWDELFPAEQARIVQLIVDKVIVGSEGLDVRLRTEGIGTLARELCAPALEEAA